MSIYDTDNHSNECENAEYFYCKKCNELVHDSENNQCPACLKFIPRMEDCVCDMLPTPEPGKELIRRMSFGWQHGVDLILR